MAAKKILVLAINPKDTVRLRLDEEVRQIKEALKLSEGEAQLEVVSEQAVRASELHRYLLAHKPQIVHFAGHGEGRRGLAAEDKQGRQRLVSTATLKRLFRLCGGVECVVLNACHSVAQVDAIAQYVPVVIGMNQSIGDAAAIRFSEGFYDGLSYERSYEDAFEFGLLAIEEEGIDEAMTPVLRVKGEREKGKHTLLPVDSLMSTHGEKGKGGESAELGAVVNPRKATVVKSRVFISYKRDREPDQPVATALYEALGQRHEVFIDQAMLVGTRWAEQIERELRRTDVLVVLLSEASVGSEMVQQEVALAHEISEDNGGRPQILPVRLAYREPFEYPLSVYLDPLNWAMWTGEADTAGLIADLEKAIAGGNLPVANQQEKDQLLAAGAAGKLGSGQAAASKPSFPRPSPVAQPKPLSHSSGQAAGQSLELPEGTMDLESAFYVERADDAVALETVRRQGVTITIKGPRQMGKSSLLNRVMAEARVAGKQVAFLDFQLFDRAALQNADEFYQQFCFWLTDELDLEDAFTDYWNKPLGHTQRCTRYMERHVLKSLNASLVLAMDEVERIFDTPFRNDFFSMLRSWHNQRATRKIWKQLDLALVTSTEPYQLITDLNQSPFNVGQVLALQDFSAEQVDALNERHGEPLTKAQLQQLMELLNGHPYLVRRSLYLVASGQWRVTDLFAQATNEQGPFGAHLRNHLFRLASNPALVEGLLQILRQEVCPDEHVYFRLHGAGLVDREGQRVFACIQLYANYFGEYLKG